MSATENQIKVLQLAEKNGGEITKQEVCKHIRYYNNTQKYVGEILSRMVKNGQLIRIKNGLYKIGSGNPPTVKIENQIELF